MTIMAVAYIRVSRMGKGKLSKWEDKFSPETQLNAIKNYCKSKGLYFA
ncbi:hypothetical protein SAMN05421787_11925 [Virgibacillus pantothenticus]|nr:hypothetical protein SAMN05421787_11925 [Virgibacillus pantothenticus]